VIARLNAARDDGGNIREAYEAILLGEEGAARRMPSDVEFEQALRTRDLHAFTRGFYLLATCIREQLTCEEAAGPLTRHPLYRAHHVIWCSQV